MSDKTIFNTSFNLDVAADVSIDFSAGHSYSGNLTGSNPWGCRLVVDGNNNVYRGGTVVLDVVQIMGACGQLGAGNHTVQVIWFGSSYMTLSGATLRILVTKR